MIHLDHDHCLIIYSKKSGMEIGRISLQPHDAPQEIDETNFWHPLLRGLLVRHDDLRARGEVHVRETIAVKLGREPLDERARVCAVIDHDNNVIAVHLRDPDIEPIRVHESEARLINHPAVMIGDRHEEGIFKRRYVVANKVTGIVEEEKWLEIPDEHPIEADRFYHHSLIHVVGDVIGSRRFGKMS